MAQMEESQVHVRGPGNVHKRSSSLSKWRKKRGYVGLFYGL